MKRIDCDYLVIGSGAGGSVVFRELAKAGKDVLLVEEGRKWKSSEFKAPISELTQKLYRGGGVTPFLGKPVIGFGEGVALGGTTVINGGLLWRTPEWILDEWSNNYNIDGYSSDVLSPYFSDIESSLSVKNELDIEGYDLDSQLISQAAISLGWKVVSVPRATINCSRKNQCGAGCPSDSKQSVDKTYIASGESYGGRIYTGVKIIKLNKTGEQIISVVGEDVSTGLKINIKPKTIFLAAGAINTPLLLKNNKLSKVAGDNLKFHVNLKVFAKFPNAINSNKDTIFTRQVQEFEKEGLLIMGTNYNPPYLSTALAHLENSQFNKYFEMYENSAVYTPMIKVSGSAKIYNIIGNSHIIMHKLDIEKDLFMLRKSLLVTSRLLFQAGADFLILPLEGSSPVKSYIEAKNIIFQASISQFQLLSVHAMSSCAMGVTNDNVCNLNGRVRGLENLYVCDASILPSNIGESPQGTIMAFAHAIIDRYLNQE
jgi:choline dehydrogenase-like flavoprotein